MVIHLFNWYNASQYNFVPNVLFRSAFPAAATSAERWRRRLCANSYQLLITLSLVPTQKHVHLQAGEHTTGKKNTQKENSTTALMMSAAGFLGQHVLGRETLAQRGKLRTGTKTANMLANRSHRSTQHRSRCDVAFALWLIALRPET